MSEHVIENPESSIKSTDAESEGFPHPEEKKLDQLPSHTKALSTGLTWKGYDNYIGARLFTPNRTELLKERVLNSGTVRRTIMELFRAKPGIFRLWRLKRKARKILDVMAADFSSKNLTTSAAYLTNAMLSRMYHQGIHTREKEVRTLYQAALDAEKREISMVFLPCHRSHIDYIVLSYVFFRLGIGLPFIAAGDNLNLPLVGNLLKHGGAFFIRRKFDKDPLYTALFKEYVECLLDAGFNMEVFVEGTRSRTGKLLSPKFGVLKVFLETLLSGRISDVYLVPISIGYDKVIEASSYVNELMGAPKEAESLRSILASTKVLQLRLGRIDIRFASPFSLRDYISEQIGHRSDFDPYQKHDDFLLLLRSLGYRICSDINQVAVIMPTALVGTILLSLRGRGISKNELIERVNWLKEEILAQDGQVAEFGTTPTAEVVDRAVKVLKDLVGERKGLLEPVYHPLRRFELSYYRNQLIHLYVHEAAATCCMYSQMKRSSKFTTTGTLDFVGYLNKQELVSDVGYLSQLLKGEFIFRPGRMEDNLENALIVLSGRKILSYDIRNPNEIKIPKDQHPSSRASFEFHCAFLWPFIETYWLAALSIYTMHSTAWVNEKTWMRCTQDLGKTLYYQGDLAFFESINRETLRNALDRLIEIGVLEGSSLDEGSGATQVCRPAPIYAKCIIFENPKDLQRDALYELVENIGRFRREGGNRRDSDNLNYRLLQVARLAGPTPSSKL